MKKYVSFIAIMLCSFVMPVSAVNPNNLKNGDQTECKCCKKCKDTKCIALCKQWSGLSAEAKKGEEGQKIKEECMKICKEKKCCSADGMTSSCGSMMEGKDCCKKK
jgi:hypothetical protein